MNRILIIGKPSTISAQLAALQCLGIWRNGPAIRIAK